MNRPVFVRFLSLCLAFWASAIFAQELTLWKLLEQSHEAARTLSYVGVLQTRSGEHSQSSRIEHFATSEGEFEAIEKLDGQPSRWVRHNDRIQNIIPERKLILSERRQINATFPRFLTADGNIQSLAQYYQIQEMPSQRIAGRVARVLRLQPKDVYRHEYRLFIDRENGLLLKSESADRQGEVLERVMFTELNLTPDWSRKPNLLEVGPGWRESSTKINAVNEQQVPYMLPKVQQGYVRLNVFSRMKDNNLEVHQAVYSDGLATLSVFIQKAQTGQNLPSSPMSHGALMSKSEIQGSHLVTVMGEVPLPALDALLKSVKWKSQ